MVKMQFGMNDSKLNTGHRNFTITVIGGLYKVEVVLKVNYRYS